MKPALLIFTFLFIPFCAQTTAKVVSGKQIIFIATDVDRYGRTIAKIYYDNKYLSEEIIKAGLGWWYYQYSDDKHLGVLQDQAQEKKLGLWQDINAIPPWVYRELQKEPSN